MSNPAFQRPEKPNTENSQNEPYVYGFLCDYNSKLYVITGMYHEVKEFRYSVMMHPDCTVSSSLRNLTTECYTRWGQYPRMRWDELYKRLFI